MKPKYIVTKDIFQESKRPGLHHDIYFICTTWRSVSFLWKAERTVTPTIAPFLWFWDFSSCTADWLKLYKADPPLLWHGCKFGLWSSTRMKGGRTLLGIIWVLVDTALSRGNKNKGLRPPGTYHLVGDIRHALSIYSIFSPTGYSIN